VWAHQANETATMAAHITMKTINKMHVSLLLVMHVSVLLDMEY
jgi:hypothetical protein